MKHNRFKAMLKDIIIRLLVIFIILDPVTHNIVKAEPGAPLKDKFETNKDESISEIKYIREEDPYYLIMQEYEKRGYKKSEHQEIALDMESAIAMPKNKKTSYNDIDGKKRVLIWEADFEYLEWNFQVVEEGLYEIIIEYYPLEGTSSPIQRSLMIDGEIPFLEAHSILLPRMWMDAGRPKVNNVGDEVRPRQVEVREWNQIALSDNQGMYSKPFYFYFNRGNHTMRLNYIEEPVALGNIIIRSPEEILSYQDTKDEYDKRKYKKTSSYNEFEAEDTVIVKSDPMIRRESDPDPETRPASGINLKLNTIGGWRWRKGNQSITWEFEVPEDGLYKIGFRVGQWFGDGLPVYRQILIDGKVPFREMEEYEFKYNKKWRLEILQDHKNEPYLFYLDKGKHQLTMIVKIGPLRDIVFSMKEDALLLSSVIRQIVMLTGNTPDINFEYDLDKKIPDLMENLATLSNNMGQKAQMLMQLSSKRPAMANNFIMIEEQLNQMIKKPDSIPRKLSDLNNALNSLGAWSLDMQDHPLLIDYFIVGAPNDEWSIKSSTVFQKSKATWDNFIASFIKDYRSVGNVYTDGQGIEHVIDVWISRGKEWAEIIKEMADEDFTTETGIGINMNILPASQLDAGAVNALLLSICSGKAPDVACSVNANSPVEFAIRDAVVNLKNFDDYEQVEGRFLDKIMIPFEYQDGIYALPETMNFKALFYRRDIIEELGIILPDTWEDVYNHLLPILYQHGMEFCYLPDMSTFLFQHQGTFYTSDGKSSALHSPKGYQAFKEYTELYTHYGIPAVTSSFFSRMRQGDMPIGVGDYGLYVQLSVAAPELSGRWGIAQIPGHKLEDGIIDRSTGGIASTANMILNQSTKKETSWEFLKWWTSDEVQERFGKEMESLMGVEARWNTANKNAFVRLPWDRDDLQIVEQQWEWANEMPVVLGGYFTQRHINNAWNRVVLGEENVRESLEKAVKDINRELRSKQEEYGLNRE